MKVVIGSVAACLALILSVYILLLILNIVPPLDVDLLKESYIRFVAQLTVFMYLLAAWAFWRI